MFRIYKITVLYFSFVTLLGYQTRRLKANVRALSTFFIGTSVAVMDYCPPVGDPKKDKKLVYGESPNLNRIQYYQETIM